MASINLQSKDGGGGDDGSRSATRMPGVLSPWAKIVSGEFDEPLAPVVSVAAPASSSASVEEQIVEPSSDCCPPKAVTETETETQNSPDGSVTECLPEGPDNGGGGSNAVKKPVWSKPNGVAEVVSPVMGAVSWPALGESTKATPKSSPSESLQALSDGSSLPALPVTGNSSPSLKLANVNNVNSSSTPNHVAPSGQRSMRRGGGNSGAYASSNGGVSQRLPANQGLKVESPHNTSGNPGNIAMGSYQRDYTHRESHRGGFGSQLNSGNDHHHHQRNSYRRGNGGQHPRGDGSYQGRNQEWNQHRNFNNRDPNMQPHRGFRRGYIRPPVHTSPMIHPQMHMPMRPFGNNVIYPDMGHPMYYYQGPLPSDPLRPPPPFVAPMAATMYLPFQDPVLYAKIVNQIDYYFSNDNLVKDTYLRQKMDKDGWVPADCIANFKKVLSLTDNIQLVLDAMRASTVVEVHGEKFRRRNDWKKWLMPPNVQHSSVSSPASTPRSINQDTLVSQLQGMAFEVATTRNEAHVEAISSRPSSSGDLGSQQEPVAMA